ncbi:MAG: PAS domain-containing protein, partial [Candidatus Omnitrophica bacterium]|nr:PAS domain-containing protein [Candidatus Omnitrophota bacterium]
MKGIRPLRILFVEDNPRDAELAEAALAREGLSFTARRVDTQDSLLQTLTEFQPDLIISDYAMPDFDGMQALAVSLAHDPNIPFIILTGSMNEETAVACLRGGVWDYVLKENLSRLAHAVKEALAHRDARVERAEAEEVSRMTERRLRALIENGLDSISLLSADGTLLWESPAVVRNLEYDENQFLGRNIFEIVHPDDLVWTQGRFARIAQTPGARDTGQFRLLRRSGEWRWIEAIVTNLLDEPSVGAIVINYRDITDRKQAEEALRESESRLSLALDAAHMGTFDWDIPNNRITWSRWHEELWGYTPGEFVGTYEAFSERVHPEDLPLINAEIQRCMASREPYAREYRVVWPDGSVHWIQGRGEFTFDENGRPQRMRGVVTETTDRRQAEEALRESERQLSEAQRMARLGRWTVDVPTGKVTWSEELYEVYGRSPDSFTPAFNDFVNVLHPEDRESMREWARACLVGESPAPLEFRTITPVGDVRHIIGQGRLVRDARNEPVRMVGT